MVQNVTAVRDPVDMNSMPAPGPTGDIREMKEAAN
jgi:hypothetical protein